MHLTVYIISPWSRDAEGNVPQFTLDAIGNGWQTRIEDVTEQPGHEIRIGHGVLIEVHCSADTLSSIRKTGRCVILERDGEVTEPEKEVLSQFAVEIRHLPIRATRDMAKQILVERFRQQGLRDELRDALKDVLREFSAND